MWLNGKEVHRAAIDRSLNPDSDHFEVALGAGKNRILVKVANAYGGWGFALRIYDELGKVDKTSKGDLYRAQLEEHSELLTSIRYCEYFVKRECVAAAGAIDDAWSMCGGD